MLEGENEGAVKTVEVNVLDAVCDAFKCPKSVSWHVITSILLVKSLLGSLKFMTAPFVPHIFILPTESGVIPRRTP